MEIIDVQAMAELAEKYQAFSTPTVYANEKLMARGAQSEELFMASLKKLEEETVFIPDDKAEEIEVDLVVVGASPAGLSGRDLWRPQRFADGGRRKRGLGGSGGCDPDSRKLPRYSRDQQRAWWTSWSSMPWSTPRHFPGEGVMEIEPGRPWWCHQPPPLPGPGPFAGGQLYAINGGAPGEDRLFGGG